MFPMLSDEQLRDLAHDIKTRGQIKPIVLDRDGLLLDGRNRLAACTLAGIEPVFTTYEGDDPLSLIMSQNIHRRQLSQGQVAITVAMARSRSERSLRDDATTYGLSLTRLSIAATVLTHAPDLAEHVRTGKLGLDAAYDTARKRRDQAQALIAQHQQLREQAPDLAERVSLGETTLTDALAQLDRRRTEEQLRCRVGEIDAIRTADGHTGPTLTELAELGDLGDLGWDQALAQAEQHLAHRQEAVLRSQQSLEHLAAGWSTLQDLTRRPDSRFTRDVLSGLTSQAHDLASHLIAGEAASATRETSGG